MEIKIGYDSTNKLYIIPNNSNMIINGNEIKPSPLYFNNAKVLITKVEPKIYQTTSSTRMIISYEKENGEILSPEDYKSELNNLKSFGKLDDGGDDYDTDLIFDSIESEVNYKHFLREWKPTYENIISITNHDIKIIEIPISEYDDIIPLSTLDDIKTIEEGLCEYLPNPTKILIDYCESLGLTFEGYISNPRGNPKTFSLSTHSGIEYAKIEQKYLFSGNKPIFRRFIGSYQACIQKREKDMEFIKNGVDEHFRRQEKTLLSSIEKGKFYSSLLGIKDKIDQLDVYKQKQPEKQHLLKVVDELIKKLS